MDDRTGIIGVVIVLAVVVSGCAVIDGLGGGGDGDGPLCEDAFEDDCTGSTCVQPVSLGPAPLSRSVSTCDATSFAFDLDSLCGQVPDPDNSRTAVFQFEVFVAGSFEICATSSDGFGGAKLMVSNFCENTPVGAFCISGAAECIEPFLTAGSHFLYYQEPNEDSCPSIELMVTGMGVVGNEVQCSDGVDEDADGAQDCEDSECRDAGECNVNAFGDACDGFDEFTDTNLFPPGSVDEGGCACVNSAGCDNLPGVTGKPYLCHSDTTMAGSVGLCAPACNDGVDWCLQITGTPCRGDGVCDFSGVSPPPMP